MASSLAVMRKAARTLKKAGIRLPVIPAHLAPHLMELRDWTWSTRSLHAWPYTIRPFVQESFRSPWGDYALVSHDGHGVNSWALCYYTVVGRLRMFLQLAWGGAFEDAQHNRSEIREVFDLADELLNATTETVTDVARPTLLVVCQYPGGSAWMANPDPAEFKKRFTSATPQQTLRAALSWLSEGGATSRRSWRPSSEGAVRFNRPPTTTDAPSELPPIAARLRWIRKRSLSEVPLGHGVQVHRAGADGEPADLVGFVKGFRWLKDRTGTTSIYLLRAAKPRGPATSRICPDPAEASQLEEVIMRRVTAGSIPAGGIERAGPFVLVFNC